LVGKYTIWQSWLIPPLKEPPLVTLKSVQRQMFFAVVVVGFESGLPDFSW
jgi:hypothetical protein